MCTYYLYILASKTRAIYIGVTGFLMDRVLRHRAGKGRAFTRRYRVHRLVYFQSFQNAGDAVAREKQIKKWRREKKVALIEERNPAWEDPAQGWGQPTEMRVERKADSSRPVTSRVENDKAPSPTVPVPSCNFSPPRI
jgi:putative endonuclease